MSATLRVLRAELRRSVRVRATWFVLSLLAGVAALRAYVSVGSTVAERAGALDPVTSGTAWAPFVDGWRAGLVLGALVLVATSARALAGDRESGVLRLAATRSCTRSSLVWGRLLLAPLLVVAIVTCTGAAAWYVARTHGDFGPLIEDGYEIFTAEELRAEVARGVFAVLPALVAAYAFGLFVSSLSRSATIAVSGALGLFLAFDLFKEMLGSLRAWVFASHVPTLADSSAWSELPGVVRGFSDAGFPEGLYRAALIGPWPTLLLLALGSCLALSRRRL